MTTQTTERPAPDAAPAPLCGHTVNTAKGIKPCVKPQGHDTDATLMEKYGKGHASRVQARKEYKPVPVKMLTTLEDVPDSVAVEYGGGRGAKPAERSEEQKLVDQHVKEAHESWVNVGRPDAGKFNELPRKRYQVSPEHEEAVRAMLRSAARLHGVSVRIAPLKTNDKGKHMLYWAAVDLKPHESNTR